MQFLIIGCGRVGAALARILIAQGEDVVVMDHDAGNLEQISDLDCVTVTGIEIDRDNLISAGIENADIAICVSNNENLNLMAGQMAREFFQVPLVIVRVYNTANIPVFEKPGFRVISSTELTTKHLLDLVQDPEPNQAFDIYGTSVQFFEKRVKEEWVGLLASELQAQLRYHLLGIQRKGHFFLVSRPSEEQRLQAGDALILMEEWREEG